MKFRVIPMMALAILVLANVASATHYRATITVEGAQEVNPPVGIPGTGSASVYVNTVSNTIDLKGTYSGMTSNVTNAHFHGPANPGQNAGVKIGVTHTGGTSGTVTFNGNYLDADEADILAGRWYLNIHTVNNTGGEIRGQVELNEIVPATSNWALILTAIAICAGAAVLIYRRQRALA
jgi:hypothetical protein